MSWNIGPVYAGTDFSEEAARALGRAALLAREHGQELHLLHALEEGDWLSRAVRYTHGQFNLELPRKAAGSRLARLREQLLADGVPSVEYEILEGPLHRLLPEIASERDCGVFVMGARGGGSFREELLGSTADRVLRSGALPVLLCRNDASPWRRVALATDFSAASLQAARLGLRLAPQASHYLLHACELPLVSDLAFANASAESREAYHREAWEEANRQIAEFAAALGPAGAASTRAPREGPPAAVLSAFVLEAGIDLVVLGARPRARWEANLLGSTALFASNRLGCDVLLVPQRD